MAWRDAGQVALSGPMGVHDVDPPGAVAAAREGALPKGDVVLDLDDDAVGIAGISPEVPASIRRKVAALEASLRAAKASPSP